MLYRLALIAAGFVVWLSTPAEAGVFQSLYSKFDYQTCAEAPSPEPDVVDVRSCNGPQGVKVIWSGAPDSSDVAFGGDLIGGGVELGDFFEAGDTIEWRTRKRNGTTTVEAAILRYWTGPNIGKLDESKLVVYRLEPSGGSCVLGVVAGGTPNANAKARQMADRWAQGFRCGTSARH